MILQKATLAYAPGAPSKVLIRSPSGLRFYAAAKGLRAAGSSNRKQVTIRNDDGRVEWGDLTVGEKAARTTQQTFNLGVILVGLAMTV